MTKGKLLGEYSLRATSIHVKENGRMDFNVEGPITGFGTVVGTISVTAGKTGEYKWYGVSYSENGDIGLAESEEGKYQSIGVNRWALTGIIKTSRGKVIEEGVFELATRTWSGKFYEAIE